MHIIRCMFWVHISLIPPLPNHGITQSIVTKGASPMADKTSCPSPPRVITPDTQQSRAPIRRARLTHLHVFRHKESGVESSMRHNRDQDASRRQQQAVDVHTQYRGVDTTAQCTRMTRLCFCFFSCTIHNLQNISASVSHVKHSTRNYVPQHAKREMDCRQGIRIHPVFPIE